ncbi:MAG: ABC transporter substrate-binding protein, partial [Rhizobiaceae bacterium]|nr:ABC transporter substrate-binding protein [Rhizobiaceae bacterium]
LKGYCHPARFNAMVKAGKVPQDLIDKLPPPASYEKAYFPTLQEVDDNKAAVTGAWDSVVGANVQ